MLRFLNQWFWYLIAVMILSERMSWLMFGVRLEYALRWIDNGTSPLVSIDIPVIWMAIAAFLALLVVIVARVVPRHQSS